MQDNTFHREAHKIHKTLTYFLLDKSIPKDEVSPETIFPDIYVSSVLLLDITSLILLKLQPVNTNENADNPHNNAVTFYSYLTYIFSSLLNLLDFGTIIVRQ